MLPIERKKVPFRQWIPKSYLAIIASNIKWLNEYLVKSFIWHRLCTIPNADNSDRSDPQRRRS